MKNNYFYFPNNPPIKLPATEAIFESTAVFSASLGTFLDKIFFIPSTIATEVPLFEFTKSLIVSTS